jgi:hypothetical protein
MRVAGDGLVEHRAGCRGVESGRGDARGLERGVEDDQGELVQFARHAGQHDAAGVRPRASGAR